MAVGKTDTACGVDDRAESDVVEVVWRQEVGAEFAVRGCEFKVRYGSTFQEPLFVDIPAYRYSREVSGAVVFVEFG